MEGKRPRIETMEEANAVIADLEAEVDILKSALWTSCEALRVSQKEHTKTERDLQQCRKRERERADLEDWMKTTMGL